MSIADPIAIGVKIPKTYNMCSLEKEIIELIHMNLLIILYPTVNYIDSSHSCICGPLT